MIGLKMILAAGRKVSIDRIGLFAACVLPLLGGVGCVSLSDMHQIYFAKFTEQQIKNEPSCWCSPHYEKGWKRGYAIAADGGSTVAPRVAPRCYWGPKYQNPQGRKCVDDWFRGYADGAAAAVEAGLCQFEYIPTRGAAWSGGVCCLSGASEIGTAVEPVPIPAPEPPLLAPGEPEGVIRTLSFQQQQLIERLPPVSEPGPAGVSLFVEK